MENVGTRSTAFMPSACFFGGRPSGRTVLRELDGGSWGPERRWGGSGEARSGGIGPTGEGTIGRRDRARSAALCGNGKFRRRRSKGNFSSRSSLCQSRACLGGAYAELVAFLVLGWKRLRPGLSDDRKSAASWSLRWVRFATSLIACSLVKVVSMADE